MFKFLSRDDKQKNEQELGEELANKVSFSEENQFDTTAKPKSDPYQTDSILVDDPLARSWIDLNNNEKRTFLTQSSPASIPSHAEEVRAKSTTSNSSPSSDRFQRETTTLLKEFPELPEPEKVIEVFTCSLSTVGGSISELWDKNGSLYVTEHYVCFLSSTSVIKELLAFRDIISINMKSRQLEIATSLKKISFTILLSSEEAFTLISLLWQTKGKCNLNTLAASVKYAKENKQLHDLFSRVSPFEIVLDHYMCALQLKIQQGRMYITNYYNVYFYSKIPLYPEVKDQFSLENVTGIEKVESNSIEVSFADKKLLFRNLFAFRDSCYYQLVSLWERLKYRPKTFGLSLPVLLTRENRNSSVPLFVEKAVAFLSSTALDSEGLFRISASQREIEQIQYLIDEGEEFDFFDCHDKNLPAGLLKKFFRELPECVLTDEFYNCFLTVYESKHLFDDAELIRRLKDLIKQMPLHNRKLTRYMLQFLEQVAAHSSNNKMDQKNLARIWGPILLKSNVSDDQPVNPEALKTAGEVMDLVLIMINHQKELFDD